MHDSVTVHMDAPPEKVWALVSDVTRIGEFSPETFEAEWTGDATGPAVGARFRGHVLRRFTPTGDGTDVTESFRLADTLPTKLYWAIAGRWRGKTNREGMRTTLERIKEVAEAPEPAA